MASETWRLRSFLESLELPSTMEFWEVDGQKIFPLMTASALTTGIVFVLVERDRMKLTFGYRKVEMWTHRLSGMSDNEIRDFIRENVRAFENELYFNRAKQIGEGGSFE